MDAVFIKLIEQLNSSVAVLIVVLCLVIWLTFKAGRILEKFDHHETKLDEARGIRDEMISIRTKVDLIYQNTNPNALFRSQSPLALTPKGHEAASSLSATETLDKLYGDLHAAVESENPETAYDIQVAALKVARSLLPSHLTAMELVKIKDYAFKKRRTS